LAANFDHFTKFIDVYKFTAFRLLRASRQFCREIAKCFIPLLLVTFKKPESFPHYLARCLVPARLDAAL
jgi:hypothetical protein